MNDFVKLFSGDLVGDRILAIVNAIVNRILKEQQAKISGN
jgi:hypothetical protein